MIKKQTDKHIEYYYFPYPDTTELYNDVMAWCKQNCNGIWDKNACGYTFEDEKDATMFVLRWA